MSLDHLIAECRMRLDHARGRKNSREVARLTYELKGLVHRRMKRDKRRGLFKEAVQVAAMFIGGILAYGIACPLDAYAAEIVPEYGIEQAFAAGALLMAGLALMFAGVGMTMQAKSRADRIQPNESDDPDAPIDYRKFHQ